MSPADRRPLLAPNFWLQTWPRRYGFALLATTAAVLVQYLLTTTIGPLPLFVIFAPTIIVVALLAGFGPGLLATALSAAAVATLFWTSLGVFGQSRPRAIVGLALFCGIGAGISKLATRYRRHEARLREFERVVECLEEMIVVVDRDYRYLIANHAFLNYRGVKPEDVIGRNARDVFNPRVFETTIKPRLDECFQGKIVRYEMRYDYPIFGERDLVVTYFPIQGRDGVDRVASVFQDVTDQKKADMSLALFRTLMDQSNDALEVVDAETLCFLDVNQKSCEDLGYTREELLSMSLDDIDPSLHESKRDSVETLKRVGRMVVETTHKRKDGTTFPVELSLKYAQLDRDYIVTVSRDITERKRAESALRSSEQRYRMLFEENIAGVALANAEGIILDCNKAWAQMLGYYSAEEIRGREAQEFYFNVADRTPILAEIIEKESFLRKEMQLRRKDGSGVWVLFEGLIRRGDDGPFIAQATAIDITERKRAEEELRRSEEHFRILVEQASDGIFLADGTGRYLDVNSAGAQMLGYTREEIQQLMISDVVASEDLPRIVPEVARLAGGKIVRSDWKMHRKDGSIFPGELVGKQLPDGRLQGILRDVTERRQAEDQLRRSEERFRVALKDSPITVFNQDRDLRYTWIYNPQFYWQQEVLGKTDDEILGHKKAANLTELKKRVLATRAAVREEVAIPQNGHSYVLDMKVEPLFDERNNVIGITGACMDIARLRERADRLQEAQERLTQQKNYLESEIQTELGFEEIIGQSAALREVLKKARIVAPTDSTVLLLGETGTGKELVARSVHALSGRREQNFVKLNCAAVPSGLLESELFGHEKGAFTGAVHKKIGRVEVADKGTLFLDEIGELPSELQPKLLRVLQDREFERLGGVQTLRVDVRIIAATNRDLRQDIADKTFREDLYYRLNVFPIELPPLRERSEDIPILVQHFVSKHARRMGKQIHSIPEDAMRTLRNWSWPGNVRELENMIERMVILSKGSELALPPSDLKEGEDAGDDHLAEMERDHIVRVLRETNGVLSGNDGAATRLGLKRTTLQSMMKRLGIEAQDFRRRTGTFGRP